MERMQKITDFFSADDSATSSTTSPENHEDFYRNALKRRIKEAANDNKDEADETLNSKTTLNFFLYLNPCDEVHDTYEHDPCEESPCEQNTYEYNIPNHEFEDLKKQYKKAEDELLISRKCNENLVMKQSKLTAMAKELKSSAHLLNAGVLSAEDQYELAAILGDDSHDQRFITACIFILHKRDYAVIKNLTKSGRLGNKPNAKKLDPKINLTMRNMFSARVRKNSGSLKECQKRMELFDQLLVRGIDTAKKFIIRSESVG